MTTVFTRLLMGLIFCTIVLTGAPAHATSEKDKEFVSTVRADWPLLEGSSTRIIIRTGKVVVCGLLDQGYSVNELVRYMYRKAGVRPTKVRQFIRTSTEYYCPRHR